MAPHNCYPCQGTDRWVSIAVGSEEEWRALCQATGHPEWAADPRFADACARKRHEAELDGLIARWTGERSAQEVTAALQRAGVAAFPSFDGRDLAEDPHIRERGFYLSYHTPENGDRTAAGPPWRFPDAPAHGREKAVPGLGQHNGRVFHELLGMPEGQVAELAQAKVIY